MRLASRGRYVALRLKSMLRDVFFAFFERYLPSVAEGLISRRLQSQGEMAISRYMVTGAVDPVDALNYMSQKMCIPTHMLWSMLCDLHGERLSVFDRIVSRSNEVQNFELRLLLAIKRAYAGTLDDERQVESLVGLYIENSQCIAGLNKKIKSSLASLIVDKSPPEKIEFLISSIGLRFSSLTEAQKVKLLSRLLSQQCFCDYEKWERLFFSQLSSASQLKVLLVRFSVEGRAKGFSILEGLFCNLDLEISKNYCQSVRYFFDLRRNAEDFLDARFDSKVLEALRSKILEKIDNKESCAYIRLGDGESYGFGENKYIDCAGLLRQELHWWGTELDEGLRHELQSKFLAALPRADILGVPTVLRLIRDFNPTRQDAYERNSLISRLLSVMEGAAPFMSSRLLVEDQSNLYLFDNDFIGNVVRLAKKVYVVSGVNSELVEAWNPDASKVVHIEIPTHRLLKIGNVGTDVSGIFPYVYQEYIDSLGRLAGPGVVFLFSAGFIGKILIAEVAQKGAVGLDIGQYLLAAATEKVS